jgi:hypothetical protein
MSLATYDIRRLQFFRAGIKETKRGRLYALAFVFCTAFILGAVEINHDVGIYDEGIMLTGAMRVAQGALPHRDFYANYGPGQFFTLAAIFKLFGPSILIERIWDLVVKASIACLVNVIASSLMGRLPATAVTAACILWLAVLGFPSYPVWPSLFFILLGILPLFRLFDGRYSVAGLLAAGLCIGFVVLFRYDVGFFACTAESAVLTAFGFFRRPEAKTRFRHIAALLFPFWIGTALVVVPLFIAYAVTGIIPDFIFQILEYPSKNYAAMRSLPFPGFDPTKGIGQINSSSIVYFPPLVFLASLAGSARLYGSAAVGGQRALSSGWGWKLGVLSALVFTLYLKGLVRVSAIHMALSVIPAFITFGAVAEQAFGKHLPRSRRAFVTLVLAALAVSSFASLFALGHLTTAAAANLTALTQGNIFRLARDDKKTPNTLCQPPVELRLARCVSVSDAATKAIQFIRANTGSNEPIFVGTGRHDKIFINDVAFYFIADRPPATKWYHFDPGLQTSHQIQDIIIADIEKRNTSFVILFTAADDAIEPNRSAISSGVKALDNFISDKYAVVAEFPPYRILKRRMEQ